MFEVTDDKLIRVEKVNDCPGMYSIKKVVITKEEFIACYDKWIKRSEKMDNETIIEVLSDMLSNLCIGCRNCTDDKCLDYQVLKYLIKEKGGAEE